MIALLFIVGALLGLVLFLSARKIAAGQASLLIKLAAVLTATPMIAYVSTSYFATSPLYDLVELAEASGTGLTDLPETWGSKLDTATRHRKSQQIASATYSSSGRINHYFDAFGQRQLYTPTASEVAERITEQKLIAQFNEMLYTVRSIIVWWAVLGCVALALGWHLGRRDARRLLT